MLTPFCACPNMPLTHADSGFYPPKSGIKIRRNFPSSFFWAEVPTPISDSSFPLHFGLLFPLQRRFVKSVVCPVKN